MIPAFLIRHAVSVYRQGGILAYPTEAVFGLGCDPLDAQAVARLLEIKQRPVHKGLILLASDLRQLLPFVRINDEQREKILQPDVPTTWLVKKSAQTPPWISGAHEKLAVRITLHPPAQQLCAALGSPIVSTSANPGGHPPARSRMLLHRYFAGRIDFELPGDVGSLHNPTRIIDIDSGQIIRQS